MSIIFKAYRCPKHRNPAFVCLELRCQTVLHSNRDTEKSRASVSLFGGWLSPPPYTGCTSAVLFRCQTHMLDISYIHFNSCNLRAVMHIWPGSLSMMMQHKQAFYPWKWNRYVHQSVCWHVHWLCSLHPQKNKKVWLAFFLVKYLKRLETNSCIVTYQSTICVMCINPALGLTTALKQFP